MAAKNPARRVEVHPKDQSTAEALLKAAEGLGLGQDETVIGTTSWAFVTTGQVADKAKLPDGAVVIELDPETPAAEPETPAPANDAPKE